MLKVKITQDHQTVYRAALYAAWKYLQNRPVGQFFEAREVLELPTDIHSIAASCDDLINAAEPFKES